MPLGFTADEWREKYELPIARDGRCTDPELIDFGLNEGEDMATMTKCEWMAGFAAVAAARRTAAVLERCGAPRANVDTITGAAQIIEAVLNGQTDAVWAEKMASDG